MMYAISRELEVALKEKGFPFPVIFGPELTTSTGYARERYVIEQPIREQGDQVVAPKGTSKNPKIRFNRIQSARLSIYARSSKAGAAWHDHTERAEQMLDGAIVALERVVRTRGNLITFGRGGFDAVEDEKGAVALSGALYVQDFTVDRAVEDRAWDGSTAGEVTIGTDITLTTATTKVAQAPDGDFETL